MSELKKNATSDAFWLRTLYTIGFYVVYKILDLVILLLILVQWVFRLTTDEVNPELAKFGDGLGSYIGQIIRFISGSSDDKPYPFQDWPETQEPPRIEQK